MNSILSGISFYLLNTIDNWTSCRQEFNLARAEEVFLGDK